MIDPHARLAPNASSPTAPADDLLNGSLSGANLGEANLREAALREAAPPPDKPAAEKKPTEKKRDAQKKPAAEERSGGSAKPPDKTKRGLKDLDHRPEADDFKRYNHFSWVYRDGMRITFNFVEREEGTGRGSWYASVGRSAPGRAGGTVYVGTRNTAAGNLTSKITKLMGKIR